MLKKTITYEDFNGETRTEDFYFNLSKAELVELEVSEKQGFVEYIQQIVKSEDSQQIIDHFKKIILLAYGQKSPDGRRFIKSQQLRDEFVQTGAYSELFIELSTQADSASEFVNGVIPSSLQSEQATANVTELPTSAPVLETQDDISDEDLLKMDPQEMTADQLRRAFRLRSQQ